MQGSGEQVQVLSGTPDGTTPKIVAQHPQFTGKEKHIVYDPNRMRYYFLRDKKVYEFIPETKKVLAVLDEPVTALQVDPVGKLLLAADSKNIISVNPADPRSVSQPKVIMAVPDKVDSINLDFQKPRPKPNYSFYSSNGIPYRVDRSRPENRAPITRPNARNYIIDKPKRRIFYVQNDNKIILETFDGAKHTVDDDSAKISNMVYDPEREILTVADKEKGEIIIINIPKQQRKVIYDELDNPRVMLTDKDGLVVLSSLLM